MGKQVVLVTRYFPPHSNVDSNAVYDLIEAFLREDSSIEIHVVTTANSYKADIKLRKYRDEVLSRVKVHQIKSITAGAGSRFRKLFFGLMEGFRLVRYAKQLRIEPVITLTNPPLISFWAMTLLRDRRLIYWSFDLFPDAFAADGLLKKQGWVYHLLHRLTYRFPPYAIMALGEQQFTYLKSKFGRKEIKKFLLPCGIHEQKPEANPPEWYRKDKINIAYIGNIGKAHSAEFLKNFISVVNDHPDIHFFMTIYGFHADEIMRFLADGDFKNVLLVESIPQSQMAWVDVHLVSLQETWTHISVPSKAVTAVCSGSALWFHGSKESDTWKMFEECSYNSGASRDSIRYTMEKVKVSELKKRKEHADKMAQELRALERFTINDLIGEF